MDIASFFSKWQFYDRFIVFCLFGSREAASGVLALTRLMLGMALICKLGVVFFRVGSLLAPRPLLPAGSFLPLPCWLRGRSVRPARWRVGPLV